MTTTWVPLRENYFATPLLSAKEKAYLVRKSCEAAQEVVERARSTGGPVQWRHVEKYQDVQIYAGTPRRGALTQPADVVSMCGVTSVAASVKEVAALFDLSTTRAMKEFSVENRELFYDAIVLYTLSPRMKEKPLHQVTAKWVATRSPRGVADRDFCYLECQDKFVDSHGRKGWVMCLHSIKLPGCDELTREFGFVRGSFYHSGVIVVETDRPGFVDVIHILQMNYKQNAHVSPSFVRERVAFVAKVRAMVRSTRLNEQRYLSDLELVPKKYRSRCTVCQDSFSLLLLRKMNCRKCGEVVCGACSKEFDVRNAKFMETVKLRICMHCFQLITTGPKAQIPMLEPFAASSSASLLGYVEDEHRASFLTQAPTSAAEMARASASQQRRTKIFLQSMQRQRTAAAGPPPRSSQSQGPPGYYHSSSQLRASQQLQASQQGMYPTRGSVLDHSPYSRETITYGSSVSVQRPPPSAASIFDRPHNAASAVAAPPQSMPRDFEYNRQSEHSQEYAARSRSNTQQSASRVNRASSRQENYSHNSAYRFEQQQQHQHGASPSGSFEYGMTEPSPVPYPSSLHDSESKRRDSVSSESSTSSIDIDADEGRQSANQSAPESAGHASSTLVSAAAIPRSPPPYYSSEIAGHSDHHQGSSPSYPVASSQSPGSNSDTKAQLNSAAVREAALLPTTHSNGMDGGGFSDDKSEGSMGSDDGVDFEGLTITEKRAETGTASGVTSFGNGEQYEDETKAQELSDTPAFSPPSSSARRASQEVLGHPSLVVASSLPDRGSPSQVFTGLTGQRTSEASEGLSKRQSELAFDLRESELGINTARCDRSFLDSDMRQFHDALWVMKNEQRFLESKDEQSAYAVGSSGSQPEQELQRSRAGSTRSSESKASGWSAQSSSRDRESDAVFAVSRPLFPVNNHVTSPRNSYEGMPSLYAKPQDPKRESPHAMQRQGTIAFTTSDNDLPPSYSSSVARLSAGSVSKEDRAVSRHSSSSVSSTTSSSAKAKRLASAVVKDEDEDDESNGSQSFFGAISDDAPPQFQQPRTMAGFSPSATYEVPQRSEAETKELLRKLSAPAMVSGGREGSKGEPEHENSANVQSALLFHDDDEERESDFTAFDEPIVREEQAPQPKAGAAVRFQLEKVEDVDDNEEEEEEDDMLLSARSLYKTFGSSKKITSLVGENDAFQRTFDKIQASFDMLSSDDESEDDDDYSVVKRVVQT